MASRTAVSTNDTDAMNLLLPKEDKAPLEWKPPHDSSVERLLKKPLRRIAYPPRRWLYSRVLGARFDPRGVMGVDQWFWGHRGFEYEFHRRMVNRRCRISGKVILIGGCGTGQDVPSWFRYRPAEVVGVDYFNYERAWNDLARRNRGPIKLSFVQADLSNLRGLPERMFDIVGSDAVLEHLKDLAGTLREFHRVLKPDGFMYAGFGPLWCCWGGDHVSGYDHAASGYNHLLMNEKQYLRYLDGACGRLGHEARIWFDNRMFSHLGVREYLGAFESAGFRKVYLGLLVDPRAVRCLRHYPGLASTLRARYCELDLIVNGVTCVFEKR